MGAIAKSLAGVPCEFCEGTGNSFEELPWDSPEVSRCLPRFSKASVLGHFCFTHIRLQDLRRAQKDPENFDIADLEAALERYTIPFVSFREFMRNNHPGEQEDA